MFKRVLHLFLFLLTFSSCKNKDSSKIKPTKGTITETVYASGIIKSENQYTVFSTVNGVLQHVSVAAGQTVQRGQTLFEIESEKAALSTENSRLAYQLSQESNHYIQDKIAEMETKVQAAKDKLALDQSIYLRNKNIKQFSVISEVDFERIELAYKNSKSNYEATQKQLNQLKQQLINEQNRNQINLKINQKNQSDFTIKSAFSGELFDILVKEGTVISPQTALAVIGQKNAFLIELNVDENDMVRVQIGQKIAITMDSYKGQVFQATVDKIYPIMDVRSRTFRIEAHFVEMPKKLYPNLTVEANIIIQTKNNVMIIPKSYLIDNEFVLINKDEKRKVKIGLSDYQNVEILEGIQTSESIFKPK